MRRTLAAIAVSSAVIFGAGVVGASPALAADVTVAPTMMAVGLTPTSITRNVGETFTVAYDNQGGNGTSLLRVRGFSASVSSSGITCDGSVSQNAGPCNLTNGETQTFTVLTVGPITFQAGFVGTLTITAGGSGGGGGGGGSSSPSASAPLETLSLAVSASGATCTGGNPTGFSGSWLTLPSADKCTQTGPNAKPGAKLLGWATNASFPVAQAQAQVDKKWGVIDGVINGVRMIFIPAGTATFVSGSNNLFPIWSA